LDFWVRFYGGRKGKISPALVEAFGEGEKKKVFGEGQKQSIAGDGNRLEFRTVLPKPSRNSFSDFIYWTV